MKNSGRSDFLIIFAILLVVLISCFIFAIYQEVKKIDVKYEDYREGLEETDYSNAVRINNALTRYLIDTDDWDLTFLRSETGELTAGDIIFNLQIGVSIDKKSYGPYLPFVNEEEKKVEYLLLPKWSEEVGGKHVGWEITVNRRFKETEVKPSQSESQVIFID